jgi:hypothetical protein
MTMHAGSLGQFMLGRRMDREIERQKSLPPRWVRPMIYRKPSEAARFVERRRRELGKADSPEWRRAQVMLACTHAYFSWPRQAADIVDAVIEMADTPEERRLEHGGMLTRIVRRQDETEIVFHVQEETHAYLFLDHEDACVPVTDLFSGDPPDEAA